MSLTTETLHEGSTVSVRVVRCQPQDDRCGPDEQVATHLLVFPLRGVFLKHHGGRDRVVADPLHALLFDPAEPYRVSHPVQGGDECLVLEPSEQTLSELWSALAPPAALRTQAALDAGQIAARRLFRDRLGQAGPLEIEETALDLCARALRTAASRPSPPGSPGSRSHHEDMVAAVKIALAGNPADSWTLQALARRVHSSPFHLARLFRQLAGMPVHRYHLLARMALALNEVLDSSRDFTTIGLALGFSSHSHFTATFRRTFGVTPSLLRRGARPAEVAKMTSKILTAR